MSEPKVVMCPFCDFGSGRRGMDRCAKCAGTGSGFYTGTTFLPNTEAGYSRAVELIASPSRPPREEKKP